MRRLVCILLVVLISYSCLNIVRVVDENNSLYHRMRQQELHYDKVRAELSKKVEDKKNENKNKIEELERINEWNTEIVETMQ